MSDFDVMLLTLSFWFAAVFILSRLDAWRRRQLHAARRAGRREALRWRSDLPANRSNVVTFRRP